MGFADKYISRNLFLEPFIENKTDSDLKIIVIIPIYNEPNIIECLNRLVSCNNIDGKVEVIIIINSSERDNDELRAFNYNTYKDINRWISNNDSDFISFYVRIIENLPAKHAGVGLARKIAMDEALIRFNSINRPDGIITSFDADTICEANYFTSIIDFFSNKKMRGASIYFEHPVVGSEFSDSVYKSSAYYELYLRYYIASLRYIGHPHAFHCIGSAFAVRAKAYAGEGGMNRKQAGEDFYFLQKIISSGGYGDIVDTVLHPSSRLSDRTPFGTGRSIAQMSSVDNIDYFTNSFDVFLLLIPLFKKIDMFYKYDEIHSLLSDLSPILQEYLEKINLCEALERINQNCSTQTVFRDKFFQFFNIFKVLKFLNFATEKYSPKESVIVGASSLLAHLMLPYKSNDVFVLLDIFRKLDKELV